MVLPVAQSEQRTGISADFTPTCLVSPIVLAPTRVAVAFESYESKKCAQPARFGMVAASNAPPVPNDEEIRPERGQHVDLPSRIFSAKPVDHDHRAHRAWSAALG